MLCWCAALMQWWCIDGVLCWCSDGVVVGYRDPVPCWGQEGRWGVPSVGRDADGCEHADGNRLTLAAGAMSCYNSIYNGTRNGTLGGVVSVERNAGGCQHADGDRLTLVACAMSYCSSMCNSTISSTCCQKTHHSSPQSCGLLLGVSWSATLSSTHRNATHRLYDAFMFRSRAVFCLSAAHDIRFWAKLWGVSSYPTR